MTDDAALLRLYLDGSEEAFAELVRCHIDTVYGTALRIVAGDIHLANDVTQKVFTELARKASSLVDHPVLLGWLYLSTQYVAAKTVRSEQRWRNREEKAQAMDEIENQCAPEPDWSALRPVIDSAMRNLKESDRDALLLRFFQSRTLAEVAVALGLSENAARMRVDRALDKLHSQLASRGIKSTATALGAVMAGQLATAAPATLAVTVTSVALSGAASATGSAIIFMGLTKLQVGIAAVLVVAGGSTLWSERQTEVKLRAENTALVEQVAHVDTLKTDNTHFVANARLAEALYRVNSMLSELRAKEAQIRSRVAVKQKRQIQANTGAAVGLNVRQLYDGKLPCDLKQLDRQPKVMTLKNAIYPLKLKLRGISGEAMVEYIVKADGTVADAEIVRTDYEEFGSAALDAIEKWRFTPGVKDGKPVNARVQQPFIFTIDHPNTNDWF